MINYAAKLGPATAIASSPWRRLEQVRSHLLAAGARARVHALPRAHRALARARGVSPRRQPARAGAVGRPYIENYRGSPSSARASRSWTAPPARRPRASQTDACFAFHHVNAYEDGGRGHRRPCAPSPTPASSRTSTSTACARESRLMPPLTPAFACAPPTGRCAREPAGGGGGSSCRASTYGRCNEPAPYRYVWGNGYGA